MSRYDDLMEMIADPGDDCIIWPYATLGNGYGQIRSDGHAGSVHRVALASVVPPPTDAHQAAHGPCHNRACVNPNHLSWKTVTENAADKKRDGTDSRGARHHMAKLTREQVLQIRFLWENTAIPQPQIAKYYGVSQTHVSAIVTRKKWAHV